MPCHTDTPGPVNIQIMSEDLERDGVRATLEWTQDNSSFYSYNVSVTPNPASALTTERMRVLLKVTYDIPYNISVQATPVCGNGTSSQFLLNYTMVSRSKVTNFINLYANLVIFSTY